MPLDTNDEIEARALGLRAPQMLGRHLHLAKRVLFSPPVFVVRRCARHDVPSPEQKPLRGWADKSKAPPLLLRSPLFSISRHFAPVPTPLEAGRDPSKGHHHGSDQATRGRGA